MKGQVFPGTSIRVADFTDKKYTSLQAIYEDTDVKGKRLLFAIQSYITKNTEDATGYLGSKLLPSMSWEKFTQQNLSQKKA